MADGIKQTADQDSIDFEKSYKSFMDWHCKVMERILERKFPGMTAKVTYKEVEPIDPEKAE